LVEIPSARLPHVVVGPLIRSLVSLENFDSDMQLTSFVGARRTYFDIHDFGKNPVPGFAFLASDAYHVEPPGLLVTQN
jgi:hypothetical protein